MECNQKMQIKSTVIIYKRGEGYVMDTHNGITTGAQGARAGLTAHDAAISAARAILKYTADNPLGGSLVAPPEVMALVPAHLHDIQPHG